MVKIFLSYRRADSRHVSERIYDRLQARFGQDNVFKDVDSIPLGQDFRAVLDKAVGQCGAVLAVVGPRWLTVTDEHGRRRLDDPNDFVRLELERALARGVPVIPVLVDGASLPKAGDLPGDLQSLFYRQATQVRPDPDFAHDVQRLIDACGKLESALPAATGRRWPRSKPVVLGGTALLLGLGILVTLGPVKPWSNDSSIPKQLETTAESKGSPPAEIPANQKAGRLEIRLLQISHHRGDKAELLGWVGKFNTSSDDFRFDDDLRLHAELSAPAYCYLLAFNPDGKLQPCYPRRQDVPPQPVEILEYPAARADYFPLNDGVGLQAFVLIASQSPLAAFEEWRKVHGSPAWQKTTANDIWRFDGQKLEQVENQRGEPRSRGAVPAPLKELCDFLKNLPAVDAVQVLAFPVQPQDAGMKGQK